MLLEKKFFAGEGGEVLARIAREAVDVPSLEVFKDRLDETLSNVV